MMEERRFNHSRLKKLIGVRERKNREGEMKTTGNKQECKKINQRRSDFSVLQMCGVKISLMRMECFTYSTNRIQIVSDHLD